MTAVTPGVHAGGLTTPTPAPVPYRVGGADGQETIARNRKSACQGAAVIIVNHFRACARRSNAQLLHVYIYASTVPHGIPFINFTL